MSEATAARKPGRSNRYVIDADNVHALTSSLELLVRDRRYVVLYDASIWFPLHELLGQVPLGKLRLAALRTVHTFFRELLRIFASYENVLITPEVRGELANLIAATLAQLDRQKLQYERMAPAARDRVGRTFHLLLRIEELMRKLRTRIEDRAKAAYVERRPELQLLQEMVAAITDTLSLKKPGQGGESRADEHLAARALFEVIVHHRHVAVCTRDEDVRRIISATYKLLISDTLREEEAKLVRRALQLGNLVVLKYNPERQAYTRFFESQTQQAIGEFIFSKFLPERSKVRLISEVRSQLVKLSRELDRATEAASAETAPAVPRASPELETALGVLFDRIVWYQEIARAVGLSDVHEEIRVLEAMRTAARTLGPAPLAEAVERALAALHRRRLHQVLRELGEKDAALKQELDALTADASYQQNVPAAERLREVAAEIASNARARHFFTRALGSGEYHLDFDHFRRTEELLDRFSANGFDLREGERLVPAEEVAHLSGLDYERVLRLASEHDLVAEGGLIRLDYATLIRHLL